MTEEHCSFSHIYYLIYKSSTRTNDIILMRHIRLSGDTRNKTRKWIIVEIPRVGPKVCETIQQSC